jgi:hypothetical protein
VVGKLTPGHDFSFFHWILLLPHVTHRRPPSARLSRFGEVGPIRVLGAFIDRLLLLLRFDVCERDQRLATKGFFAISGVGGKNSNADRNLVERDGHICPADSFAAEKLSSSVGKNL